LRGAGDLQLGQAEGLSGMEDQVRRIDRDYAFNLSEEEIQMLAKRGEEFERLFRCLYEIDLTDTAPLLKLDKVP